MKNKSSIESDVGTENDGSTGLFISNSIEENQKLADKLIDTGFDIKSPGSKNTKEESFSSLNQDEVELWRRRYYDLLKILNTFKEK